MLQSIGTVFYEITMHSIYSTRLKYSGLSSSVGPLASSSAQGATNKI